ncbi:hypothetical protein LTR62_002745 [Meristemomyces frigidus]|uniref:N-acetyltransferase domain-containing protein n=1 Tax=Meristemomyces frigidus TaxID=1508187 RepID=A0AAN7TQT4_9PEZI|nr:hypothetical protein LTR62_002745 [Meristemomyces frigidus]
MTLPNPILYDPSRHKPLLSQLASIHASCILQDGTLASFIPTRQKTGRLTIDHLKLVNFWLAYNQQVEEGSRAIVLQFADESEEVVAGVVSLYMPGTETGPFRSEVHKLLVSPQHRFKGIARRLMGRLEEVARESGRGLVMLDTTIGSGAELVYPKLGYIVFGDVPKYGIHPLTGELVDERWFYKDLRG